MARNGLEQNGNGKLTDRPMNGKVKLTEQKDQYVKTAHAYYILRNGIERIGKKQAERFGQQGTERIKEQNWNGQKTAHA